MAASKAFEAAEAAEAGEAFEADQALEDAEGSEDAESSKAAEESKARELLRSPCSLPIQASNGASSSSEAAPDAEEFKAWFFGGQNF